MQRYGTIRESRTDQIFQYSVNIIAVIVLIITVYPLIFVLSASVSSPFDLMAGRVWLWPINPNLDGYRVVLAFDRLWSGLYNSFYITIIGTIINLTVTTIAAYPLSRKDLKLRKPILYMFVFTMLFSGGMIPTFLLVRDIGLLNTRWAVMIPNAMSMFNFMVMRTFFENQIPAEMHESARMDGCSDFRYIWSILLPLSKPILAVMTLFYAVAHWNAFFGAMIYITNRDLHPLQVILREILLLHQETQMLEGVSHAEAAFLAEQMRYSLIVIASIPLLILYPFVQKHFVKGVMVGAVKG